MYHGMSKKAMKEALEQIAEIGENFPKLKMSDINFMELAKYHQKHPKDYITMIVLLDAMRVANVQSTGVKYYVNLEDVQKIKVRREKNNWVFNLYNKENKKMKIVHSYDVPY